MELTLNSIDNYLFLFLLAPVAWLGGICILYCCGILLSDATSKIDSNDVILRVSYNEKRKIIRLYLLVLETAAIFYYLFLPLPIIVVLLISGSFVYLLGYYDVISPEALGGIMIVALIMISAIIKSLLPRKAGGSDDFVLHREDAPALYQICDDLSKRLKIEPMDRVYIRHDALISVFKPGRIIDHFLKRPKSCLMIGIGGLKNLSVTQLRSLLAHEFAHLYHKDAGAGAFALFVRRGVSAATETMEKDLVNHWYNPAWIYISFFQKIFFRISQGAARLQELTADDIAAGISGSDLFAQSLMDFTKNQIEFSITRKIELMNALNKDTPPHNLYRCHLPQQWPDDVKYSYGLIFMTINRSDDMTMPIDLLNFKYKEKMTSETALFDSHPALKERIAYIKKMAKPSASKDHTKAESMVPHILTLQENFTQRLYSELVSQKEYLTEIEYQKRLDLNGS